MTREELIEMGYEDTVVFENPDFDGCRKQSCGIG